MGRDKKSYDFAGWATLYDVVCEDKRIIKEGAFSHSDGQQVPLIWNHGHKDIKNVIGHALLEKKKKGIRAYGFINETDEGIHAKQMLKNGDINSLSIYANKLKQNGNDVVHGVIREVSLVIAGANPGASIDVIMQHSDSSEEVVIYNNSETLSLEHGDEFDTDKEENQEENTKKEENMPNPDDKDPNKQQEDQTNLQHNDKSPEDETIKDVYDTFTDKQKVVVDVMVGLALQEAAEKNKEKQGEEDDMKQNAFEKDKNQEEQELNHAAIFAEIKEDSIKSGIGLREATEEYALKHSISNIEVLFPEARNVNGGMPAVIRDEDSWVKKVMNAVKKSPFARIKSTAMDVTSEDARARGYIKGNQKVEGVMEALKRVTTPQTIYKLEKLDRDDVLDITDFDVLAFVKAEARFKLEQEIARAILFGDGRGVNDPHRIKKDFIRPVVGDDAIYTVKKIVSKKEGANKYQFAKDFIREIIESRVDYKGSGNPTFYTTEEVYTSMLLIEDTNGRTIYETEEKLRIALRVKEIVTVTPMENVLRTDDNETFDYKLLGVLVNLTDYNVGADKGGIVTMFEDFNLNLNKHEFLIETRISGALTVPFSAISFELKTAHVAG